MSDKNKVFIVSMGDVKDQITAWETQAVRSSIKGALNVIKKLHAEWGAAWMNSKVFRVSVYLVDGGFEDSISVFCREDWKELCEVFRKAYVNVHFLDIKSGKLTLEEE